MQKTEMLLMVLVATAAVAQFSYDPSAPLDPKLVSREWRGATLVQDITYASPKGGRVPAYLFTQPNATAAPAVIFMHWGLGDRHAFYDDAATLADYGVASLLIDAPFNRPGASKDENADLLQAVIDVRRGIDLLAARKDVDPKRIAFVGLSYGAHVGALLAAQEPRLAGLILAGGLASNAEAEKNPALAPYDAEKWIAKPHAPVFLQFARNDESISREQANRFIKAASDPAIYKFYEGSHAFNPAARADRISWLAAHLGFTIPDASYRTIISAPVRHDMGRLGIVAEMPGMQQIRVRRDVAFNADQKMDVYYPFGMTAKSRVPAILVVNGQSENPDFMKAMRGARFATTFAQALAVRTSRIVIVPDIRMASAGDPAADLQDLMKYTEGHAADLQIDATQFAIITRSAGYSYGLRAAASPNVKAVALWYGNLGDPKLVPSRDLPMLVVTAQYDFWYDAAASKKFVDATGAQRIHLPDGDHGFEIFDDLEQSRDAFVKTATFLREHLPIRP